MNRITKHMRLRSSVVLKIAEGALRLGGRLSPLHRESPWHKHFTYLKNGDLWRTCVEIVGAKGHQAVKASKVKGHATEEQVEAGKFSTEDKEGNEEGQN